MITAPAAPLERSGALSAKHGTTSRFLSEIAVVLMGWNLSALHRALPESQKDGKGVLQSIRKQDGLDQSNYRPATATRYKRVCV